MDICLTWDFNNSCLLYNVLVYNPQQYVKKVECAQMLGEFEHINDEIVCFDLKKTKTKHHFGKDQWDMMV